ncbi:MAG: transcription antitermination factor NusB [Clostridia bacterium]|nr:transcription antitermination factor NusB [Clostridia bacterium]
MRRDAREAVYKFLYAELFNDDQDDGFVGEIFKEQKLNDTDKKFALDLISAVHEHKNKIEEDISKFAKGYKIERLYSTDKCALTLAFAEIKYFNDIPSVVSIDEALFLVKKYSTPESLNYVNGILAAYKKFTESEDGNN